MLHDGWKFTMPDEQTTKRRWNPLFDRPPCLKQPEFDCYQGCEHGITGPCLREAPVTGLVAILITCD